MPPLFTDGMLLAGDAAQMINPTHREGSNLAMTSGKLAGERELDPGEMVVTVPQGMILDEELTSEWSVAIER